MRNLREIVIQHCDVDGQAAGLNGGPARPTKLVRVEAVKKHALSSERRKVRRQKLVVAGEARGAVRRKIGPPPVIHHTARFRLGG